MKKAIVIGATGMVGTQLIEQLLVTKDYSEIVSFVRRPSRTIHPKLIEHVVDFDKPDSWSHLIQGDILFSCMGTTLAQAKTKEMQYKVDYTYQYTTAAFAAKNGVKRYVLVSSAGANSKSATFYMRMKGELDDAVQQLPFETIIILRPGQLDGERNEKRFGEKIGLAVMYNLNKIGLFKRYKPIQACQVARAMLLAAEKTDSKIYTLNELFDIE